ncbi:MAG: FAD-dependent oxidoreductase [Clostridia bacterium]|nr:FAD-dependent oxidoreductase [Clostridia bacterium]
MPGKEWDAVKTVEIRRQVPISEHFDVLVCGGGPAGFIAAIAAARSGAKTALVERYGFLGGAATASLVNPISTFKRDSVRVIGGIPWEFVERLEALGGAVSDYENGNVPVDVERYKLLAQRMVLEAGVALFLHSYLSDAVCDGKRVKYAVIQNKSGALAIDADVFVDATGDADLAALCGFPMQEMPDRDGLQPASLGFRLGGVKLDQVTGVHPRTPGAKFQMVSVREIFEALGDREEIPNFGGPWFCTVLLDEAGIVNVNITRAAANAVDAASVTETECRLREDAFRLFALLKRYVPAFSDSYLVQGATQTGFRESRRILGDHVLTEEEYVGALHFEDSVARGAHPVDMHRARDSKQDVRFLSRAGYVPYRSMISSSVDNVIVAGRCISADRPSFASIRVQATAMALGHAAGTAAALSVREGTPVHALNTTLLRSVLKEQGADL